MRCSKTQILLQGYVDGELPPARMKRVRTHVDKCAACAKSLGELSALKTLLAENRPEVVMDSPPEFFWSQVEARIKGEAKPRQVWRRRLEIPWLRVFGWATAALAALCVAGWLWLGGGQSPSGTSVVSADVSPTEVKYVETPIELYAEAYHSAESKATIVWTEGMPVISLEL